MCTEKKSVKEILIYGLIYPAILGSMIYDLFPTKGKGFVFDMLFFIQCFIVAMYVADYCHLYKNLKEKYPGEIKKSYYYIPDLLVSISLWIAFKFSDRCLFITTIGVAFASICFLIYACKLNYHKPFYIIYFGVSIFLGVCSLLLYMLCNESESTTVITSVFIIIISGLYIGYVVFINCKCLKDKKS